MPFISQHYLQTSKSNRFLKSKLLKLKPDFFCVSDAMLGELFSLHMSSWEHELSQQVLLKVALLGDRVFGCCCSAEISDELEIFWHELREIEEQTVSKEIVSSVKVSVAIGKQRH